MSGMDRRPHILGIPINALPMSGVLSEIDAWIDRGEQKFICTADVHALVSALGDPSIRRVYESADGHGRWNAVGLVPARQRVSEGGTGLWAGSYVCAFPTISAEWLQPLSLRCVERHVGPHDGKAGPGISAGESRRNVFAALSGTLGRGKSRSGQSHQRDAAGYRLGWVGSAETGSLDGDASPEVERACSDRRRRRVRHVC